MRDKVIFGFSILWIIALSVTLTIFLAIPLFFCEIFWYQLTDLVQMTAGKIWHNFLILMNYLINPLETKLSMPDFPSSASGLHHFAEVKNLFMLVFFLTIILIPFTIRFIKENLSIVFHNALRVVMLFPLAIGVIAWLIGFDRFFVAFHEVLFRDNSWLFDPATDPIISVLPEQFFMHSFLIFLLIYELIFFVIYRRGTLFLKKKY
ncbi:TIGR01906 family membrane protein [Lactococcus lactis]|uniref:TIGR01906 family membrane protein n=1 Tax=Lactococcus lactis TaxID=1358 RepID=UPI002078ADC1|nr:TIGR01906 family membrane protein [Lactococcus lactis]MCT0444398.1 TIGR01906 family membrane protein [Lactococcus lactis subsp. lactis]MDM7534523.1 TIGR01906 family membrane protein [Lactococcus lactis]USI64094.1 TIGR01906 family membrane protein [Lactococcus lactis subsp. lactis]